MSHWMDQFLDTYAKFRYVEEFQVKMFLKNKDERKDSVQVFSSIEQAEQCANTEAACMTLPNATDMKLYEPDEESAAQIIFWDVQHEIENLTREAVGLKPKPRKRQWRGVGQYIELVVNGKHERIFVKKGRRRIRVQMHLRVIVCVVTILLRVVF